MVPDPGTPAWVHTLGTPCSYTTVHARYPALSAAVSVQLWHLPAPELDGTLAAADSTSLVAGLEAGPDYPAQYYPVLPCPGYPAQYYPVLPCPGYPALLLGYPALPLGYPALLLGYPALYYPACTTPGYPAQYYPACTTPGYPAQCTTLFYPQASQRRLPLARDAGWVTSRLDTVLRTTMPVTNSCS